MQIFVFFFILFTKISYLSGEYHPIYNYRNDQMEAPSLKSRFLVCNTKTQSSCVVINKVKLAEDQNHDCHSKNLPVVVNIKTMVGVEEKETPKSAYIPLLNSVEGYKSDELSSHAGHNDKCPKYKK